MNLATQFGVGAIGLIVLYLVVRNESALNSIVAASVGGLTKEIAALQGR